MYLAPVVRAATEDQLHCPHDHNHQDPIARGLEVRQMYINSFMLESFIDPSAPRSNPITPRMDDWPELAKTLHHIWMLLLHLQDASSQMETAYRDEVSALSEWCYHNNLCLNISETKEMIMDYRKLQRGGHSPLYINGAEVERVNSIRYTSPMTLPGHSTPAKLCTIESIPTACITVWYASCTAYDRKALKRVARTVESIIGSKLPDLQDMYQSSCLRKISED
ncbi:hypothetical protein NFI96_027622, partial [Prochilodus magdalenae]